MKFKISKQVKTFLFYSFVALSFLFAFRKITEGFTSEVKEYRYVNVNPEKKGGNAFPYSKTELLTMAKGKKKLSAINFAQFYTDPLTKEKGFILIDDPTHNLQNQTGGPTIEFSDPNVKPKVIFSSLDPQTSGTEFPIELSDKKLDKGITIRNLTDTLSSALPKPICTINPKTKRQNCTSSQQFDFKRSGTADSGVGKGNNLRIEFVFTD